MTPEELRAKQANLEEELAEVRRQLVYADCPGEGHCHGCASWCDRCGDVGTMCEGPSCDRHRCQICGRAVEDVEDIDEGLGYCPEHAEPAR
jgi:coenzyme F420-reducing hydrogenase gamma subunit